jgi:hypothetical protein
MRYMYICGPGSVVGIATAYGLDGPEIESRWGRDFPHLSRLALRPTQSPVKWVPGFSREYGAAGEHIYIYIHTHTYTYIH